MPILDTMYLDNREGFDLRAEIFQNGDGNHAVLLVIASLGITNWMGSAKILCCDGIHRTGDIVSAFHNGLLDRHREELISTAISEAKAAWGDKPMPSEFDLWLEAVDYELSEDGEDRAALPYQLHHWWEMWDHCIAPEDAAMAAVLLATATQAVNTDNAELLGVKHFMLHGELTPDSPVSFHTVMQFDDGSIHDFLTEAVVDETRESNGVMYHYFRDGAIDGEPRGRFGWPVHQFDTSEVTA